MRKKEPTAQEIWDDMVQKSGAVDEIVAVLKARGIVPKINRTKRQVIYKTKFVVRKARAKKGTEDETAQAREEAQATAS